MGASGGGQEVLHVVEPMQRQRCLVRHNPRLLGPEPRDHQIVVLAGREVNEAVDPPPHAPDAVRPDVLPQELRRVSGFRGLPGGEVPVLRTRHLVEEIPARIDDTGRHAQNVTHGLLLCNRSVYLTTLRP